MRIILCALLAMGATLAGPSEVAFTIAEPDLIPEGIAYDPKTQTFYVGSTFKRKIVAIERGGRVRDFTKEGQDGAFGFVGMRVDPARHALWAVTSSAGDTMPARGLDNACLGCATVMRYDLNTGKLLKKYELGNKPAAHFLNDLAVTAAGDVFITDTGTGDLYRITRAKDALEKWVTLGPALYPNGIDATPDGRTLFVATEAGLRRIDVLTAAVTSISRSLGSIDGLYFHENSLIAIQPFQDGRKVARLQLSPAGDSVAKIETLEVHHPTFQQPTTGTVVGQDFYYIANAQLQLFRGMYRNGAYDKSALKEVVILKKRLN
jgi:sugar lactone lactonase YvrE